MRPSRSSAPRAQSASSSTGRHSGAGTPRAKEIVRGHDWKPTADGGQIDHEARAGRIAALVAKVAAVRPRVRAGDREAEAGAGDPVAGHARRA